MLANKKWFFEKNAEQDAQAVADIRTKKNKVEYKVYKMLEGSLWVETREQEIKLSLTLYE